MKLRFLALVLAVGLTLSGCAWLDGSYVSVTPHREQRPSQHMDAVVANNYQELQAALEQIVSSGQENAALHVAGYPTETLETGVRLAARTVKNAYPMGAYAVEDIQCELGTSGGVPAVAVRVIYRRTGAEIRRIQKYEDMDKAEKQIVEDLENCTAGTVFLVENYTERDLIQFVQDYAAANPQKVMEHPQVSENIYGTGKSRVVELLYTYQNSREDLRSMQDQVEPVFDAAILYVSGEGADQQKFSQLYAFLMERFEYKVETSLTPAYSLLRHGVGDSRAFATVYAAMCRGAGLECLTVTGTCNGEPRTWNILRQGEHYYHVDLLRCSEMGRYHPFTDGEMTGYVWDYSAYPACTGDTVPPVEETVPATTEEIVE